jgi:hypothetical protein
MPDAPSSRASSPQVYLYAAESSVGLENPKICQSKPTFKPHKTPWEGVAALSRSKLAAAPISFDYVMRRRHPVAARLAGVGAFETAHADKPDCYGAIYTDQM